MSLLQLSIQVLAATTSAHCRDGFSIFWLQYSSVPDLTRLVPGSVMLHTLSFNTTQLPPLGS
jgi:hypothetical protein